MALAAVIALGVTPVAEAKTWTQPEVDSTPPGSSGANGYGGDVALDGQGNALIGWTEGNAIKVRTRTATGVLGPVTTLATAPGSMAFRDLQIRSDDAGNAVAAWVDVDTPTPGWGVTLEAATRPAGGSFGPPQTVATDVFVRNPPSLSVAQGGTAALAWNVSMPGANSHEHTEAALRPAGATFGALERVSPDEQTVDVPRIAIDSQGTAIAVWDNYGNGAEYAVHPAGTSWGAVQPLGSPSLHSEWANVAFDRSGNALLAWMGATAIESRYWPAGGPLGPMKDVSPAGESTLGTKFMTPPGVGFDGAGNATVIWRDLNSAQLFAASAPGGGNFGAAQAVSPDGQGAEDAQLAVSSDGTAFAVWQRTPSGTFPQQSISAELLAAVRPPGGSFGAPHSLAPSAVAGRVAADSTGEALAVWTDPGCARLEGAAYTDVGSASAGLPACGGQQTTTPPTTNTPPLTMLKLKLSGPTRQRPVRRRRVIVVASCTIDCRVAARGSLGKLRLRSKSYSIKAGARRTIVMKLSRRAASTLRRLLKSRPRKLKVTVTAKGSTGQTVTARRTVRLLR